MKVLYWIGLIFVTMDALTWVWDLTKYKVWSKVLWRKHIEDSIVAARNDFKHGLHKNIYRAMMWSLAAIESVAYVYSVHMAIEAIGLHLVIALVLDITPLGAVIYNTLRSIRLVKMPDKEFKKLQLNEQDISQFTWIMIALTTYGLGSILVGVLMIFKAI